MILTDSEIRQVRRIIEAQAGMNEELLRRCGDLIHMDNFDEAVRSAFVLLEERLRNMVPEDKKGLTGTMLAGYAFNINDGPLAKHLGRNQSEREGLRDLGFVPKGKHRDFQIDFKDHNDQGFFDALYDLVAETSQALEETLSNSATDHQIVSIG